MNCPYCKDNNVITYYKAEMPNILAACPKSMLKHVRIFPFEARLCLNCWLGFNAARLDDNELNLIYDNYIYISPSRGIGSTKYTGMIETLKRYYGKEDKLVEIGCSGGYLLNVLKEEGYRDLTGIEPGPQAAQARKLGLDILNSYFNDKTFAGEVIDGFFLMHVFEHFLDPFSVLRAIRKQLSSSGKLIMEIPNFSGYHHQHLFFYNLTFLNKLCSDNNLKIVDIYRDEEILRVVITHSANKNYKEAHINEKPDDIKEFALSLNGEFKNKILWLNNLLLEHVNVFWWGAGSSSIVLLNQVRKDILEKINLTVVDGDKDKWQDYIPSLNIKVQPFTILKGRPVELLIIASQFYKEITDTIQKNNIYAKRVEHIYDR